MKNKVMHESFDRPAKIKSAARIIIRAQLAFGRRCTRGVPPGVASPKIVKDGSLTF